MHHQVHNDVTIPPLSELQTTSYKSLLNKIINSNIKVVLIGEGTHGTQEFSIIRNELTKILIDECGFNAVLCEGDAQPFIDLNQLVGSSGSNKDAAATDYMQDDVLEQVDHAEISSTLSKLFENRFPNWMWSNQPMAEFISWLRTYNTINRSSNYDVQLIGMDIQSPFDSIEYIINQLLEFGEIELVEYVSECYAQLLMYQSSNIRRYGNDVYANKIISQETAVKNVLCALEERHNILKSETETVDDNNARHFQNEDWYQIINNAHAIVASEAYHRQRIYPGHTVIWNDRTRAMMDSIIRCSKHISSTFANNNEDDGIEPPPRLIVWAHNSHIGDMRSTGYSSLGQISLGQLCRETFGSDNVFLIGMTTHEGTVRAAYADKQGACWQGSGEVMELRKAMDNSHESILHSIAKENGEQAFGIYLKENQDLFNSERLERFVGSCYLPQTEMMSHYTLCNMATQFDYIFHVDQSTATV